MVALEGIAFERGVLGQLLWDRPKGVASFRNLVVKERRQ